jgi:release factor glutamine methyltransferase
MPRLTQSKKLLNEITASLHTHETEEARAIAFRLLDHLYALSPTEVLKNVTVPEEDEKLTAWIHRLNNHEPVQYVIGKEYFFGRPFTVNPNVLIPRPETEELVREVLRTKRNAPATVVDVGTGSGCLAVTLALELPGAHVIATDISNEALQLAATNAVALKASVLFLLHNILTEDLPYTSLDLIVSNPPYITLSEKSGMSPNVLAHEPHLALFVPTDDPLLFYKALASQGTRCLKPGGDVMAEINPLYADDTHRLFTEHGYADVKITSDMQGKPRILKATR